MPVNQQSFNSRYPKLFGIIGRIFNLKKKIICLQTNYYLQTNRSKSGNFHSSHSLSPKQNKNKNKIKKLEQSKPASIYILFI